MSSNMISMILLYPDVAVAMRICRCEIMRIGISLWLSSTSSLSNSLAASEIQPRRLLMMLPALYRFDRHIISTLHPYENESNYCNNKQNNKDDDPQIHSRKFSITLLS